jgi:hypothetical protein
MSVGRLQGLVDDVARQFPLKSVSEIATLTRERQGKEATQFSDQIVSMSRETAWLLLDALKHSPLASTKRQLHFREAMSSHVGPEAAKEAVRQLGQLGDKPDTSPPPRA